MSSDQASSAFKTIKGRKTHLKKRNRSETRFKLYGLLSIALTLSLLIFLVAGVFNYSYQAFRKAQVKTPLYLDPSKDLYDLIHQAFDHEEYKVISAAAEIALSQYLQDHPDLWGTTQNVWLPLYDGVDQYLKGSQGLKASKKDIIATWQAQGRIALNLNKDFFTQADSREPELAGIWGAVKGTFYTLLVTLIIAFPLGIATAIYLEEFAKRTKITTFIEININNLASVPSIIFGLLGLAIYINTLGIPRSSPLVGGMTLALITMPIIVIAARSALQSVPKSMRQAARGLGASDVQVTFHHVLPYAMPGILTGTILGMARALGESAPLLMIGMVAFIPEIPQGILDPATTLPVQIFSWVRNPEPGFMENAAAAILVLLIFLVMMNVSALWLRQKFEQKW